VKPGFNRLDLKPRYDVPDICEDGWHTYSGQKTNAFVRQQVSLLRTKSHRLLNAGAGCYQLQLPMWEEFSVDLFTAPLGKRERSICASVELLPFVSNAFDCVICVGEVLAYCDPARAISEFARVLAPSGLLICDFGNSRSIRYYFTSAYGRSADIVTDYYNGSSERVWVYSPDYIREVLTSHDFQITTEFGIHTWSAFARRIGMAPLNAVRMEKYLYWLRLPTMIADLMTFAAVQRKT
jgi:SAM-dependent methyltransferase